MDRKPCNSVTTICSRRVPVQIAEQVSHWKRYFFRSYESILIPKYGRLKNNPRNATQVLIYISQRNNLRSTWILYVPSRMSQSSVSIPAINSGRQSRPEDWLRWWRFLVTFLSRATHFLGSIHEIYKKKRQVTWSPRLPGFEAGVPITRARSLFGCSRFRTTAFGKHRQTNRRA